LVYLAIYKPFDVLSQFTKELDYHKTLADILPNVAKDIYPVGRLDRDSEGLLLLTNDRPLTDKLLNPKFGHKRTYYAQVEGIPNDKDLDKIRNGGILIENYTTLPADVELIEEPQLPERNPPIRFRKNIHTSWLSLTLQEGKNRQVRKMCASIGFPCLRLIRYCIEGLTIEHLIDFKQVSLSENEIKALLFIR